MKNIFQSMPGFSEHDEKKYASAKMAVGIGIKITSYRLFAISIGAASVSRPWTKSEGNKKIFKICQENNYFFFFILLEVGSQMQWKQIFFACKLRNGKNSDLPTSTVAVAMASRYVRI